MNSELRKRKPDGIHPTFVRVCFGMANVVTNLGGLQKKLCSLQNLEILEVLHIFFHQKITYTYFSTKKSHIIFLCTYFSTKNQISLDPPQKKEKILLEAVKHHFFPCVAMPCVASNWNHGRGGRLQAAPCGCSSS